MNIFEKYGSYEAVKQAAVNYKNSGDRVTAAGLELQCLEYRRQHNIFDVGDWFVSDTVLKPFKIVEKDEDYLKLWCKEHTAEFSGNSETITQIFKNARHATDAEIKAGKRL